MIVLEGLDLVQPWAKGSQPLKNFKQGCVFGRGQWQGQICALESLLRGERTD